MLKFGPQPPGEELPPADFGKFKSGLLADLASVGRDDLVEAVRSSGEREQAPIPEW